jgi:hypothetical protein
MTSLLLLVSLAHAACPATLADVQRDIATAKATYLDDADAFPARVTDVLTGMRCASVPIPVEVVADVHALVAMDAFIRRDSPAIYAAIAGVKATDANFAPSDELAPPGSSLRKAFDMATVPAGVAPLPNVAGARWRVDGRVDPAAAVPSGRAVYVQQQDAASGLVRGNWYLPAGGTLADLGLAAPAPVAVQETTPAPAKPRVARPRSPARKWGWVVAATSGAGGLTALALGAAQEASITAGVRNGTINLVTAQQRSASVNDTYLAGYALVGVGAAAATTLYFLPSDRSTAPKEP